MVFISAGHVYAPVSAASRCTFPTHSVKWIYGCSLSFFARLAGFRQPFFSNHPFQFCRGFKAHPVPRAVRAVTQGYMGYRQRKTKRKLSCRRAHSQETRDNKPSIALQCHVSFLSTHVWMFLRGSITAPPRLLFLPSVLIDVIFHQPASPWCQCACMWVGVCVCGSRSCDHAL